MPHFEREFWQAVVTFGSGVRLDPGDLVSFLSRSAELLPGAEMNWQMPALTGAGMQFEIGPGGVTSMPPDFMVGSSPRGWVVQFSSRQLLVRHQQLVVDGRRTVDLASFPDRAMFADAVARVIDAAPVALVESARRTQVIANYAMFVDDYYPGSVVAELLGNGTRVKAPPAEGVKYVNVHQEIEFEDVLGRQCVWNDTTRVGNWFAPDGVFRSNSAVVRNVDLKTAIAEPAYPLAEPVPLDVMPPLSRADVKAFFLDERGVGIARLVARVASTLPKGVEFHE